MGILARGDNGPVASFRTGWAATLASPERDRHGWTRRSTTRSRPRRTPPSWRSRRYRSEDAFAGSGAKRREEGERGSEILSGGLTTCERRNEPGGQSSGLHHDAAGLAGPHLCVAIPAVDGATLGGLEGHLGLGPAFCAGRIEHLSRAGRGAAAAATAEAATSSAPTLVVGHSGGRPARSYMALWHHAVNRDRLQLWPMSTGTLAYDGGDGRCARHRRMSGGRGLAGRRIRGYHACPFRAASPCSG